MDECGCDLVFISSHWGCRPTHEWFQGRVFSRSGANAGKVVADASGRRVTVGRLSDTGYGTVAGLCGANCGHVMYPFSPGGTELPDREFASQGREFGRTGAERYALTQRQRALERKVRKAKREAASARQAGADDVPARLALGRAQGELRAFCADNRLTRMPGRERAYGVGAQPRGLAARRYYEVREEEPPISKKPAGRPYAVNRKVVNGEAYKARFRELPITKKAAGGIYREAVRILEDRDGTNEERMSAVSWRTGRTVVDTFNHQPLAYRCMLSDDELETIRSERDGVVLVHNHPGSHPSLEDIMRLDDDRCVRASVIVGHDGSIYCVTGVVVGFSRCARRMIEEAVEKCDGRYTRDEIKLMVQDYFYDTNGEKKWFRVVKRPSKARS
jgi:hypothetical protein